MSSAEALRRCPHAVFLRPRHGLYRQYSRAVWETVAEIVPRLERTGLDEGYLDLGTVARDFTRARAVAAAVQTSVRAKTSLTCSLGVGTSKVVCKVASDRRKPGGVTVVPPGSEARFLAPLAVRLLPGVGPRAEERLRRAGIETMGGLAALTDSALASVLPGSRRAAPARPRPRDRPARPRARGRDDLRLGRGHVRARHLGPRAPPRRGPAARGARRDPAAATPGSRDAPSPRSSATPTSRSGRVRRRSRPAWRRPGSSGTSPAPCSIAGCATVQGRSGSSESGCPGSRPTAS